MGWFNDVVDDAKDAVDDAVDKGKDVANDVGEAAGDVAEGAKEAGSEVVEGASDVANEVSEGDVGGAVDEASETASEVGNTAAETAGNVASGSADTGTDAFTGGSSGGSSGGGGSSSSGSSGGSSDNDSGVDVSVSDETVVETDNYEAGKEIKENSGENTKVKFKGDAKVEQQENLLDKTESKFSTTKKQENTLEDQIQNIKNSPSKQDRIASLQDRIGKYKRKSANSDKIYNITPLKNRIQELKQKEGLYQVGNKTVSKNEALNKLRQDRQEVQSTQEVLQENKQIIESNLGTLKDRQLQEKIANDPQIEAFENKQKLKSGDLSPLAEEGVGIDIPLDGDNKPDFRLKGTGAKVAAGFDTFTTGGYSGDLVGAALNPNDKASKVVGKRTIEEAETGSPFKPVQEAKETATSVPGLIGTSLVGGSLFTGGSKAIGAIPKIGSAAQKTYQAGGAALGAVSVGKTGLKAKKEFDKGKTTQGIGTLTELGASTYGFYKGSSGTAAKLKPKRTAEVTGSKFDLALKNRETGTATGTGRAQVKVTKESYRPIVSNKKTTETVNLDFPYVKSTESTGTSYALGTARRTNSKGETIDSGQYILSSYTKAGKSGRDIGDLSLIGTKTQKVGSNNPARFSESSNVLIGKKRSGSSVEYLSKSARSESEQGLINTKVELAGKGGKGSARSGRGSSSKTGTSGSSGGSSGGQKLEGLTKVEVKGGKDLKLSTKSVKDIALDASGSGQGGSVGVFGASTGSTGGYTKTRTDLGNSQTLEDIQISEGGQELKPVERVSTKTKTRSRVSSKDIIKPEAGLVTETQDTISSGEPVNIDLSGTKETGKTEETTKPKGTLKPITSPKTGTKTETTPVNDIKEVSIPKTETTTKTDFINPQAKLLSPKFSLGRKGTRSIATKGNISFDKDNFETSLDRVKENAESFGKEGYSSSLSAELLGVQSDEEPDNVDPVSIRPIASEEFTF